MPAAVSLDDTAKRRLAEEYLSTQDERFVSTIRQVREAELLIELVDRWRKDPRPWARRQALAYLDLPFDVPGHALVVKRLFKQAEENGDDEIVARCLVEFDRIVRRRRVWRLRGRTATQQAAHVEILQAPPSHTLPRKIVSITHRKTQEVTKYLPAYRAAARLFSWRTRYYLQRRAWRYFRTMALRHPERYLPAAQAALLRYRDEDFKAGENLLDSWSFMHLCFGSCPAIQFTSLRTVLKEGKTLAALKAAPRYPKLWESEAGRDTALHLIAQAASGVVRTWAVQMHRRLRTQFPAEPEVKTLLALLDHADEDLRAYGTEWMNQAEDLAKWPVDFWLQLLQVQHPASAQMVCEALQKHVRAERLSVAQCVTLACSKPASIVRQGLEYLRARSFTHSDLPELKRLASAHCLALGRDIAEFALRHLGKAENYTAAGVIPFFDSLQQTSRTGAWEWLAAPQSPGWNDPLLWSQLSETPFDDLRLRLVDALTERDKATELAAESLERLWISVLLGVHRGGRQKLKAVKQVRDAIAKQPADAPHLLPVIAAAVRSVRGPEARAALSALLTLIAQRPELESTVAAALPELNLHPEARA